jgi:hypothetical protein
LKAKATMKAVWLAQPPQGAPLPEAAVNGSEAVNDDEAVDDV